MRQDTGCKSQAMIEFTFSMVVAVLLIVGMVYVFRWTGNELAARRQAHESQLGAGNIGPSFFPSSRMVNTTVSSNIFGTN